MRLIEPLGLLHGPAAGETVATGLALWLAGGPSAFTLARLIERGTASRLIAAPAIPAEWDIERTHVTRAPRPWVGLAAAGPQVMGVLNVTPDSFSDGGIYLDPGRAIAAAQAMIAAGATILDIGGESTRPGAAPVTPGQEQARILPVIRALAGRCLISVDTRHANTMAAALDAGADIINDVSGLTHDPAAAALLARSGCPVVLMHMRGVPSTMARYAHYDDPAVEITLELAERIALAETAGIARDKIAIDPGIGFAKNTSHNRDVLLRLPLLANLSCRIILGVSRKSLIGQLTEEKDPSRRFPGSVAAGLVGVMGGATILRVHDVPETIQALRVWRGIVICETAPAARYSSNVATPSQALS